MATVRFSGVNKSYGTTSVVTNLDLELPDGSITVLVGPSGCGKSTSLRMLAGLETVSSGTISIGDRDVTHLQPRDRDIAMVFQNYALYPHLSVAENIAFPLRATKTPRREALARASEIGESLGLSKLMGRKPKDLSGGQQQRVAIGRAIIREPSVFLFDEPLSNLDAKLRVETRTELLQIQRRLGITSVYVTHDQEEAMNLSDVIVVMERGRIAQIGTPEEIYRRPVSAYVADFVGETNLLPGRVMGPATGGIRVATSLGQLTAGGQAVPSGSDVTVAIRPEAIAIGLAIPSGMVRGRGQVTAKSFLGALTRVAIEVNGVTLTVDSPGLAPVGIGDAVEFGWSDGAPLALPGDLPWTRDMR